MNPLSQASKPTRDDVEGALLDWLEEFASDRDSLSAWESHCFAMVLTFLRYGYYERALDQINFALNPPIPLPVFPMHHLMTLDQLRNAVPAATQRSAAVGAGRNDEGADPSD